MSLENRLYKTTVPFEIFALSFSNKPSYPFRMALGSFIEKPENKISIIQFDKSKGTFRENLTFNHKFPSSKIMWIPDQEDKHPDLLVTSGENLKIWTINDNSSAELTSSLKPTANREERCAPLTSFDWNPQYLNIICSCSIDTTCCIWDISTGNSIKQLIAHDKEVFDINFSPNANVFATVGADCSLRKFDSRDLSKSDIIYEHSHPILRLSWNKNNENYIAFVSSQKNFVTVIDIRKPFIPACRLYYHTQALNHIAWSPDLAQYICSVGDDKKALIWDQDNANAEISNPVLNYDADKAISSQDWNKNSPEWIGIGYGNTAEILRID